MNYTAVLAPSSQSEPVASTHCRAPSLSPFTARTPNALPLASSLHLSSCSCVWTEVPCYLLSHLSLFQPLSTKQCTLIANAGEIIKPVLLTEGLWRKDKAECQIGGQKNNAVLFEMWTIPGPLHSSESYREGIWIDSHTFLGCFGEVCQLIACKNTCFSDDVVIVLFVQVYASLWPCFAGCDSVFVYAEYCNAVLLSSLQVLD